MVLAECLRLVGRPAVDGHSGCREMRPSLIEAWLSRYRGGHQNRRPGRVRHVDLGDGRHGTSRGGANFTRPSARELLKTYPKWITGNRDIVARVATRPAHQYKALTSGSAGQSFVLIYVILNVLPKPPG